MHKQVLRHIREELQVDIGAESRAALQVWDSFP